MMEIIIEITLTIMLKILTLMISVKQYHGTFANITNEFKQYLCFSNNKTNTYLSKISGL